MFSYIDALKILTSGRMITVVLIVIAFIYAGQTLWLRRGLGKVSGLSRPENDEPTVAVIVAARDEELYIADCMQSLIELDYPASKLEIVIVNDGSSDRTREIAESFTGRHPGIKVVTTRPGRDNLRGKTNAVAQGIEACRGEFLMFTDADCVVPREWVRETVASFDARVGIVGGFTMLKAQTLFEGLQALDWVYLFSLSSAMAGRRLPLTVIGNNLSVRRSAYAATGGFSMIPFSVTEDYALVQAIVTRTKYAVVFPVKKETLVTSRACRSLRQLYRQKQRWGVGGLDMVFRGLVMMLVGWLNRLLLVLTALLMPGAPLFAALVATCIVDLLFLWKPLKTFGRIGELKYFPLFELYFTIYVLALPFIAVLSRHVVWKERKL